MPALRGEIRRHPRHDLTPVKVFHHTRFSDAGELAAIKREQAFTVSVCIPTLDEAETIGPIVRSIRETLMDRHALVDELWVIDSGSTDGTREIAAEAGATVRLASEIHPNETACRGKGENLWKALHVAKGDLLCFVDGDISNFTPRFVTGLLGPLLTEPAIDYVKAFYERPFAGPRGFHPTGGGRVSEILVRPLLSLFYPELTVFLQPLAGEYAARREVFESLAFPAGYGVELAHLVDLARLGILPRSAQVDLDERVHRNRSDEELGRMAFGLLQVLFRRLERDGKLRLTTPLSELLRAWQFDGASLTELTRTAPEPERPAIRRA
ncbi:MAG TPA: glucosyl-3-phosphoglycerate synthase [Luteolibacter sp.]